MEPSDKPEFESSQFRSRSIGRRASDHSGVSNADLLEAIEGLRAEVRDLKMSTSAIETAFPLNDLGKPDHEGHRLAHKSMIQAAKIMESYKVDATKKVLMWGVGGVLFILTTGIGGIGEHLKKVLGL